MKAKTVKAVVEQSERVARGSLRRMVKPTADDVQEAYSEAADHLDQCAAQSSVWDNPEEMRAAYRLVAKRIRASAKRCGLND